MISQGRTLVIFICFRFPLLSGGCTMPNRPDAIRPAMHLVRAHLLE